MAEPIQPATVVAVRDVCQSVREMVLEPRGYSVGFQPGQWVSLRLPVDEHPPLVRAYSMAEPPSPSGQLVLVFDRVPGGAGSGYLFSLQKGEEIALSGPYGNFVVPRQSPQAIVFVARFTGIVPIRCVLKHLVAVNPSVKLTLIYGMPRPDERLYHEEFANLAEGHSSFRYLSTVLNETGPSELDLLKSVWTGTKDFLPMVSGVKEFVRPIRRYLSESGFDRKEMKFETYD